MDNRELTVVSEGHENLRHALAIAWQGAPGAKATHYRVVPDATGIPTLILLWHEEREALPLPFTLDAEAAAEFVRHWLHEQKTPPCPIRPFDGSTGKAFRVFTEDWGHVFGHTYAVVGVQPAIALYGK